MSDKDIFDNDNSLPGQAGARGECQGAIQPAQICLFFWFYYIFSLLEYVFRLNMFVTRTLREVSMLWHVKIVVLIFPACPQQKSLPLQIQIKSL